jgi:energy-coupling factor transporter ATP-binding protein EcfA2
MSGAPGEQDRRRVTPDEAVDGARLAARASALGVFVRAADGIVAEHRLAPARGLSERAGQRLALSRDYTVVALAGATGSGKSSLFNTLSGLELSEVGPLRPTTSRAHACVWAGNRTATGEATLEDAGPLLDWLDIPPRLRFSRESALDAEDEAALRGLVLLDLPDFDSLEATHRAEADRLLDLVDLVVWVTDPQKYADQVIHERYLRTFHGHRDSTLVVLNQADRLSTVDVTRCVDDLLRLLDADGLAGVPVLPTVAVNGPLGVAALRGELEKAVASRQAALHRLGTDLDEVTEELSTVVGPPAREPGQDMVFALTGALAGAVAVPALVRAAGASYRIRAMRAVTWPPLKALRRRSDPLARLRGEPADGASQAAPGRAAGQVAPASGAVQAQRSAARLAARTLGDRAAEGLPEPWASSVTAAARSRLGELPYALDEAVARTDLGTGGTPVWWRLVGVLQWLLLAATVGGVGWLLTGLLLVGLGDDRVRPALLAGGGLVAGLLLPVLALPLVALGANRARRRAGARLRTALAEVTSDLVLHPVRERLDRYAAAREALAQARR